MAYKEMLMGKTAICFPVNYKDNDYTKFYTREYSMYCILGIVHERKLLQYVDRHSIRKKKFANLVTQLNFLVINKK